MSDCLYQTVVNKSQSPKLSQHSLAILSGFSGILFLASPGLFGIHSEFSPMSISPQRIPADAIASQQTGLESLDLPQAWDITTGSSQVIIAVIDDAIDVNHPDLKDNMLPGWDFVDGDNDPSPGPCVDPTTQASIKETHGTSVAGIIAARGNNNLGITGINWQVSVLPLRIGCAYSANYESMAIAFAISKGAHIINASYAGPEFMLRNADTIRQLGEARDKVLLVTAAGNYHVNNDVTPMYPGSAPLPNIITIASSNSSNQLSHWSQFGSSSVDVAAPGEQLMSTIFSAGSEKDYDRVSGTSFSTAVVSGIAGLIKAVDLQDGVNDLAPGDVKGILQSSGIKLSNQTALLKTDSIVNAARALSIIESKSPVISLQSIKINDIGSNTANGVIDPLESFVLQLELENLWDDASNLQFELLNSNSLITPVENTAIENFWQRNSKNQISFRFQAQNFTTFQRIPFKLKINAQGSDRSVNIERNFELTSGPLVHNGVVTDTIQQSGTDEIRQWQFAVPAQTDKVAIELDRTQFDNRTLGLLASVGKKPQIYFKETSGSDYTAQADFRLYSNEPFERLEFNVGSLKAETIHILVFNKASNRLDESIISNKKYQIKACYFNRDDTNKPPKVDAGINLEVNPGDSVVLTGTMSDDDGEITKSWWSSETGVGFSVSADNKISFTAPQSGSHTFVLTAIDNGCKKTVDSVTVSIKDENSGETGLLINPKRIEIEEGSAISVQVIANYGNVSVPDIRLISGPEGLQFVKSSSSSSFDRLTWQDTSVPGTYIVVFGAEVDGNFIDGKIIIEIKKRGGKASGGGCTAGRNEAFDPILLCYLVLSSLVLLKRHRFIRSK